jgi:hypothetical protein
MVLLNLMRFELLKLVCSNRLYYTFPNPTIVEVTPATVPVKAGEFNLRF